MLGWPHSGFGAYLGPLIVEREGLLRVARSSARAPVAESRLRCDAERAEVELVADRADGPYAGVHRMTALEFLARWVDHVPERYEVRVRYAGADATRRRVWWRRRGIVLARARGAPPEAVEPEASWPALQARRRRWAELLRRVFKVEVEVCPDPDLPSAGAPVGTPRGARRERVSLRGRARDVSDRGRAGGHAGSCLGGNWCAAKESNLQLTD
jgi:hypothetical protein